MNQICNLCKVSKSKILTSLIVIGKGFYKKKNGNLDNQFVNQFQYKIFFQVEIYLFSKLLNTKRAKGILQKFSLAFCFQRGYG